MTDIQSHGMLVRVAVSKWTARKLDRAVTAEVAREKGASRDAGRYNKLLIAADALAAITSAENALRAVVYRYTLPWADEGVRLLPAASYPQFAAETQAATDAFWAAVEALIAAYPDYVLDAKKRLNGMFRPADYPGAGELRNKFACSVSVEGIPAPNDFRVGLGAAAVEDIKRAMADRQREALRAAVTDTWGRVYDVTAHLVDRLSKYEVDEKTGKQRGIFRDTLVTNIADLTEILPALNVTRDPDLDAVTAQMKSLAGLDPELLRSSEDARKKAVKTGRDILTAVKAHQGAAAQPVAPAVIAGPSVDDYS